MNKSLILFLFLLSFFQISTAQFLWYENETNTYKIEHESTQSGTFLTKVTNPDKIGINTNSKVSKFNRDEGKKAFLQFDLYKPITDFSSYTVTIKAYIDIPTASLTAQNSKLRVYFDNSSVGGSIFEQLNFTVGQEWQSFTFNFDGTTIPQAVLDANGYDRVELGFANGSTVLPAMTYYIDSISGTTDQVVTVAEQPVSWLSGSWGITFPVYGGERLDSEVAGGYNYIDGAQQVVDSLPAAGHIITNLSNFAKSYYFTLRSNDNVDIATEIDELLVPSLANEQIILDVLQKFKDAGKKNILYISTNYFDRLGPEESNDADFNTAYAAWVTYYTNNFAGDEYAAYRDLVQGFILRIKEYADGYWLDTTAELDDDGNIEDFVQMIRDADPGAVISAQPNGAYFTDEYGVEIKIDSDGIDDTDDRDYKIINFESVNKYQDFTSGHITPLGQGAPPNSWGYEEYTLPAMVKNSWSVFEGKTVLKHGWFPMRDKWHVSSANLIFGTEDAYRFAKTLVDANAGVTFATTIDDVGSGKGFLMAEEMTIMKVINDRLLSNPVPDYETYERPAGAHLVGETPTSVYHAADDLVFLTLAAESNAVYTTSVVNPDLIGNTHTNVSSMLPSANNGTVEFILTHPFMPNGTNKIDFSFDYYSTNSGGDNSGSGNYSVRLYNSILTDQSDDRLNIIGGTNRIGGSWQTENSVSEVTLAADPEVVANGGYDRVKFIFNNYVTAEDFYIDNITFNFKDPTSDLATSNSWLYNYSPDAFNAVISNVGGGSSHVDKATDIPIEANSSTTVLEVIKGTTKTSGVQFYTGDFDYTTSTLTFRVYPVSSTITAGDPTITVIIRKEGTTNSDVQKTTATKTIAPDKWNEVTFTFADLTSTSNPTDNLYDQVLFFFNSGTVDSGATYYIDAVQNATSTLNWVGATDSDWATANNWGNAIVPNESYNVKIHETTVSDGAISTFPSISTAVTVNNLSLTGPASLVFTNGGTLTTTESVTYNRPIEADKWYLMSSPVIGENYDDTWVADNGITSGTGNNRAISTFDNTSIDNSTHWRYFQAAAEATPFNVAQGYSIRSSSGSSVSFTGSGFYSTSQSISISRGVSNYNLVSNPFTAYLNLGDFFADNTTENLLENNNIYVWDATNQTYNTKLSGLHSDYELAHGQGFFIEAGTVGGSLTFDIDDVSHQSTDTFQKKINKNSSIKISIIDEDNTSRNAEVYFINATTTGFDDGYDGELFTGASNSFALFSELINNNDKKYQVQSIPFSLIESSVVSLGLIAKSSKIVTFSAEILNVPTGINVYLEDRQKKTFTLLNEINAKYEVTLDETSNGVGRFFLRTSSKALNLDAVDNLNSVGVYNMKNNTLKISGLSQGKASVKLFNVLGKQVFNSSFIANGNKEISLPLLSKGVYIVQLESEKGRLNKKIVL